MPTTHMMLDIETFGDEFPVVIGAVKFSLAYNHTPSGSELFVQTGAFLDLHIDVTTVPARPDPATVMWWLDQDDGARAALRTSEGLRYPLPKAFAYLTDWFNCWPAPSFVWSHATYDPVVLDRAAKSVGATLPWGYRSNRDLRTLFGQVPDADLKTYYEEASKGRVAHKAVDDCLKQIGVWKRVVEARGLADIYA